MVREADDFKEDEENDDDEAFSACVVFEMLLDFRDVFVFMFVFVFIVSFDKDEDDPNNEEFDADEVFAVFGCWLDMLATGLGEDDDESEEESEFDVDEVAVEEGDDEAW